MSDHAGDHAEDVHAQLAAVLLPILRRARESVPQPNPGTRPLDAGGAPPAGAGREMRLLQEQGCAEAAWRGAQGILPAVIALGRLRGDIAPWDGLIHRRCSQRLLEASGQGAQYPGGSRAARASGPAGAPGRASAPRAPGGARAASRNAPAPTTIPTPPPGGPRVSAITRGGWELLRTRSTVQAPGGTWLVRHELVRRPGAVERPVGAAAPPVTGGPRQEPRDAAFRLRLSREDLRAWAAGSGDGNALHLRSGAAARAGLAVDGSAVIAHGLLLAALSLALVPGAAAPFGGLAGGAAGGGATSCVLRFPTPLEVSSEGGAPLLITLDGTCVNSERRPVLLRGSVE